MRECMQRVVDAKALPGFGAGRGEELSLRRPEVNGLVDLSDAPAALPRAVHAQSRAGPAPKPHQPPPKAQHEGAGLGPFPRAIKDPALAVPDRAMHPEELLAPT